MAAELEAVQAALAGLREGFAADGYDLLTEDVSGGVARLRVIAGPEACEECLIPKDMLVQMLKSTLAAVPAVRDVELSYPGEA